MNEINKSMSDEAIRELIAVRAYELWENHGRPHGNDVINWYQAEQDIMTCVADERGAALNRSAKQAKATPAPSA